MPLSSQIITYRINEDNLNITKRTIKVRSFNLNESIDYMKRFHLDYLVNLIGKEQLNYVEENLLNSIQWYYEAVKTETNMMKMLRK